ncbi:MAG: gliding motility-associated C-terminal domain-containing protein, partial [Flavobacterium sp.]
MEVKIKTVLHKYALLLSLLVFYAPPSLLAQTISAPTLGLPGNPVTAFCANEGTVTYQSTFTISGSFGGGNQFILELSNASGSFVSPIVVANSATFTGTYWKFDYVIPIGTAGEGYKLRVRSTAPAITSQASLPAQGTPAYFEPYNKAVWINNKISTVDICGGGSFTLFIDGPTPSTPNSPLSTPGLTYIWKKNNIVQSGQTGPSLSVSTAGDYFVAVDYGDCTSTSNAYSQHVIVSIVPTGSTFTVTPSSGTICGSTPVVLSTTAGYVYQWFLNGVS